MEWGKGSSTPNSQRMRKMCPPDTLAFQPHTGSTVDRLTVHPEMGSSCLPPPLPDTVLMGSGPHAKVERRAVPPPPRGPWFSVGLTRPVWGQGCRCQGMSVAGPSCDLHSPPVHLGGPVLALPPQGYNHCWVSGDITSETAYLPAGPATSPPGPFSPRNSLPTLFMKKPS